MHELQALLTDVQTALAALPHREPEEAFNIFRLLRKETDKVNLHSRFLAELLNPKGSHGMGAAFLVLFLKRCGISPADFHVPTARTLRERDRIDILIRNDQQAIIIENKIWAGDQDRQLERYAEIVARWHLKWYIFYLTPFGHEPSTESLGKLATHADLAHRLQCISYQQHIQEWVAECIALAPRPAVLAVMVQYAQIVNRLINNSMTDKARAEMEEVIKLTATAGNALTAFKLMDNWKHVRYNTEYLFWTELIALVAQAGFPIADEKKFTDDRLNSCLYEKGDPWYGIVIPLDEYRTDAVGVTLIIERGDRVIKYGVRLTSADDVAREQMFADFSKRLADLHCSQQPGWPARRYSSRQIDFQHYTNPDTITLADPQIRQEAVAAFWEEVMMFLEQVRERLPSSGNV